MNSGEVLLSYLQGQVGLSNAKSSQFEGLSARELARVNTLCALAAQAVRREGELDLKIRAKKCMLNTSSIEEVLLFASGGCVVVRLHVYAEAICVFLPLELVHELASKILKRERSAMLMAPDQHEMTALGFLIARTLSTESAFKNHRVYLTAVDFYDAEHAPKRIYPQLDEWTKRGDALLVECDVKVSEASFPIVLAISRKLKERLSSYASLDCDSPYIKHILSNTKCSWQLSSELELGSVLSILNLQQGQFIPLFTDSNSVLPGKLSSRFNSDRLCGIGERVVNILGQRENGKVKLSIFGETKC